MIACTFRRLVFGGFLILLSHVACLPLAIASAQTRDSAGVSIIENDQPVWTVGREWRLSNEPALSIGAVDGPDQYTLFRVTGSVRLSDGRIVVANGGTRELRFYDQDGEFSKTVGREGGGPGEFERLTFLRSLPNDSLMVWDHGRRTVSVFDDQATYIRSYSPQSIRGRPVLVGSVVPLQDGTVLFATFSFRSNQSDPVMGLSRDNITLLRCDSEGELVDTVGVFRGDEFFTSQESPRIEVPFARSSYFRAHQGGFVYGDNADYEISYHDSNGSLIRITRKAHAKLPVTRQAVEETKQRWLDEIERDDIRQRMARLVENVYGPPTMPVFSQVLVDVEGNLWVREHMTDEVESQSWTVFDSVGTMLGTVTIPPRFRVFEIGTDYVLGRWRDEMDTDYVRIYGLTKP